jgi:hypothetical protein
MDELPADCWAGLHGNVYDLTDYSNSHPGGARVITNLAGIFHSQGLLALVNFGRSLRVVGNAETQFAFYLTALLGLELNNY